MLKRIVMALWLILAAGAALLTAFGQAPATGRAPSAMEVLIRKARALEGRGRLDLASQTWRQILVTEPDQAEALAGMARWAHQNNRADEARGYEERLKRLGKVDPSQFRTEPVKNYSAQAPKLEEAGRLARNKQFGEAMRIYREVFGDDPPPGGWALAYYETLASTPDGLRPATAGLQKLVERFPESAQYRLALGRLWSYRPETRAGGIKLLEGVAGPGPGGEEARLAWRQALVWDGPKPANRASMTSYVARYQDPDVERMLRQTPAAEPVRAVQMSAAEQSGFALMNAGKLEEAQTAFEEILKNSPRSAAALAGLGYVAMKKEEFASAVEYFEVAKAAAPDNKAVKEALDTSRFFLYQQSGTRAMNAGEMARAKGDFQEALTLRPTDLGALQGLGGTLMKMGDYAGAAPVYEKLVKAKADDAELWRNLFQARLAASGPKASLALLKQMPVGVLRTLMGQVSFQLMVAAAQSVSGERLEAERIVAAVQEKAKADPLTLGAQQQMELAGLLLSMGRSVEAESYYRSAARIDAGNVIAWEGLLGVLLQTSRDEAAYEALRAIPPKTYEEGLARPNFLRSAALLQSKFGRPERAEELLARLLKSDIPAQERSSALLMMASTLLAKGDAAQADEMASRLVESDPLNADAWKILLAAKQQRKLPAEAAAAVKRIPPAVRASLEQDPDFIGLAATLQEAAGDTEGALQGVRSAMDRYAQLKKQPPAGLQLQFCWLLLNGSGDERELHATLAALRVRQDLTAEQEKTSQDIWSVWSRRRADAARKEGDLRRCVAILEAASRLMPRDAALKSDLAGAWLEAGEGQRAMALYRSLLNEGSSADDFAGAIGAALAQHDAVGATWLEAGLRKYPRDARILNLAGQQAAQRGDYARAERYWREALALKGITPSSIPGMPAVANSPEQQLERLLVGESLPPAPAATRGTQSAAALPPAPAPSAAPPVTQSLDPFSIPPRGAKAPTWSAPATANTAPPRDAAPYTGAPALAAIDPKKPVLLEDQVREQLNALEGRNAPYFGAGAVVQGRDGRSGFEKRSLQEGSFEASYVFGEKVRAGVAALPVTVSTGASDGTSELRLGMLPKGVAFDSITASGVGAEGQISTATFGLRGGTTPRNFLVPNWVGAMRFRPANGPITVSLSREALRDTLLSFAGIRDSVSKQVWGGVVANNASLRADFGSEDQGFYLGGGYQTLRGKNVATNTRLDVMLGGYKRVLVKTNGALTVGGFATGMTYDKNLRFFTFGHGGYFSPQRYILFSVPVTWRGVWNRQFEYSVSGSMGPQTFREDSSAYFPTLPQLQGRNGPYYPEFSSTGLNYSLDMRGNYMLSPHWFLSGALNVNNARNFSSQSLTIQLRYSPKPQFLGRDYVLPSVPDWRGQQPFRLGY